MHTSVVSKENSSVSQTESKSPTSRMLSQTASIKLSFVNIVLTILIVWLHVSSYYDLPESVGNIAIISVPCFFAISSYLYFISFNFEDVFGCYKSKLRTRVKSLLIPFIIFNILGLIFSLIAYKVHPTDYNPIEELTLSRISMLLYRSQFNGPLWYMRALFEFVIFAPVIGWILSRHKYSLLIVLPFYFICGTISYFSFLHWMIPICLGAYLAIYHNEVISLYNRMPRLLKWGGVIISGLALLLIDDVFLIRSIAPICILCIVAPLKSLPHSGLSLIAPYTMIIYCLHLPLSRLTSKIPVFVGLSSLTSLLIATILTIVLCILIGMILKRSTKIWTILTGGR